MNHPAATNISAPVTATNSLLGVTADGKNLTDDGRIGLSVQPNSIQGVDNANNLTESAVERAHARTAGCDEGPVDIKQQQLHAAILS